MSSVGSTSFFTQDQNWFTSQSSTSATALAATTTALFSTPSSTSGTSTDTSGAESSLLGSIGLTMMNASTGAAVLAAQEASDRTNAANATNVKTGQPTTSALNVASQVTVSGSLSADFGSTGPSDAGAYQFLTGSDLQAAFKAAMTGQQSNGAPIDTVTVSGNTLTASTSGLNAHPVFTLTLKPNSGLYTFSLDNPIDLKASRLDQSTTLDLSGLMQGVEANGATISLPNSAVIQVHNGTGASSESAGVGTIHEGGLAYTGPDNTPPTTTTTPAKPTPYTPPINPLTGKGYSADAGAAAATFGATSVLTLA